MESHDQKPKNHDKGNERYPEQEAIAFSLGEWIGFSQGVL
jgi:hypothetical protein